MQYFGSFYHTTVMKPILSSKCFAFVGVPRTSGVMTPKTYFCNFYSFQETSSCLRQNEGTFQCIIENQMEAPSSDIW